MVNPSVETDIAITININPHSYISIPKNGKMVRQKWQSHPQDDQKYFLVNFLMLLQRNGIDSTKCVYRYELTEKDNVHVHYNVPIFDDKTKTCVALAKDDFCLLVDKKMPTQIKDRCVLIKPVFDRKGWVSYVVKQDPYISDDEPIEVPKYNMFLRKANKDPVTT